MKNPFRNERFFAVVLSIFISVFFVALFVYGVTTIGTNVSSDGTGYFESASTSNDFWVGNVTADDDDYLYMDASSSQYLMWDNSPGQFSLSNDLEITGNASTTGYIRIGTISSDGDDYLYFDATNSEEYLAWDEAPGEFDLSDDLNVGGKATSTGKWVGAGGEANNINMTNDLYVQDGAEIDGGLWADSATTTDTFSIGTGSSIRKLYFGVCDIDTVTINASTTAYTDCQNATGVAAGDKVFLTATSSLPDYFIIQAASSTVANKINIRIYNLGWNGNQATGGHSFYWQAIR